MISHIPKLHNIRRLKKMWLYILWQKENRENLITVFSRPRNMKEELLQCGQKKARF